MDTVRGYSGSLSEAEAHDIAEDVSARDLPPIAIGQDERRMQVRAYNHWAGLLGARSFPGIEDLDPENLPDFGPYSVLLDFSLGIENPGISYLGDELAAECGMENSELRTLADVPGRSLLTRITDHYMQILANQAPIGFEAEFVNQRGATILYRGILLPYSSDDDTIDFIYGVINWKELADPRSSDELLLEISQVLDQQPLRNRAPLADWADGPGALATRERSRANASPVPLSAHADSHSLPRPSFGLDTADEPDLTHRETPQAAPDTDWPDPAPGQMGLGDWLAAAREGAVAARTSEDRTRSTLYEAIGRAYDFSIAADQAADEFEELLADAGLATQIRAPMTPVVKLVFGADYDKTRLTEYAAALAHAHRLRLPRGALGKYLGEAEGGLKGVVQAERRMRKEDAGKDVEPASTPRAALAKKLRSLPARDFTTLAPAGSEFALVMIRRGESGTVDMIGEVPEDVPLVERAARKLIG